jgi:propionyl-CoA carboxylase alpha chain
VRLYAEDPAHDWQPQSGTLHRFAVPGVDVEFDLTGRAAGLRLDSGVEDGSTVAIHYDPMLAKVISWAPTRAQAALVLAGALARSEIHGVITNRDLLVNVLRHKAFLAGETDTAFFDRHGLDVLARPLADDHTEALSGLAAALATDAANRAQATALPGIPSGWRNVISQPQWLDLHSAAKAHHVTYRVTRDGLHAEGHEDVRLVAHTPTEVVLDVAGVRRAFRIAQYSNEICVDSALGAVAFAVPERFPDPSEQVAPGSLLAPMPGSVVRIAAAQGDTVSAGQPILWLEAMKMQHQINAPADGVVAELPVHEGQQVEVGTVLAVVTTEGDSA